MRMINIAIYSVASGNGLFGISWGFEPKKTWATKLVFRWNVLWYFARLHELQINLKAKLSRNEVLQYRGKIAISKFKSENPERQGQSRCSILGCCHGVDLECFGCHPGLLAMGIPCEQQPTSTKEPQRRDCFCDTSCILFDDCCDDHFGACADTYLSIVSMLNRESDN